MLTQGPQGASSAPERQGPTLWKVQRKQREERFRWLLHVVTKTQMQQAERLLRPKVKRMKEKNKPLQSQQMGHTENEN